MRWAVPRVFAGNCRAVASVSCWRCRRTPWSVTLTCHPRNTWDVRDGGKGPLVIEGVKRRGPARTETGGTGPEELLLGTRERQADGTFKHDYYLSNAAPELPLKELARVSKAAHRIEECIKNAKGEAGLADYQVRNWIAWHHHQTLSMLAAWFLNQEARRGKNPDPGAHATTTEAVDRGLNRETPRHERPLIALPPGHALVASKRTSPAVPPPIS